MPCDYFKELISADLDGELGSEESDKLKAHIAGCAKCSQFAQEVRSLHDITTSSPPLVLPKSRRKSILRETVGSVTLWSRLVRSIMKLDKLPRRFAWVGSVAVIVVVLGIALKFVSYGPQREDMQTEQFDREGTVLKLVLSENDIVATSSKLRVVLTEDDITETRTIVLSGNGI